ncbi:MAG: thioredoxin domain-containing protein [Desulfovibrionaceae bacterium]
MLQIQNIGITLALILCMAVPASAAQTVTDENLTHMLREALNKNPELVLDVLRKNSESVLDIAQQGSTVRRQRALQAQWREDAKQAKKVKISGRAVRGEANAPVTIIAFSDFTCPYCQQGAATVERILSDYGKKVRFVFKHMPLGKDGAARTAAEYFVAANEQGSDKAWDLYKILFDQREKLVTEGDKFIKVSAEQVGLNMQKLASDVRSKKTKALLDEDMAEAQKLGIEGTPYFLVNDLVIRGALPLDLFKSAVDMAMDEKNKK